MNTYIGIDLGTSSVKLLLVTAGGVKTAIEVTGVGAGLDEFCLCLIWTP